MANGNSWFHSHLKLAKHREISCFNIPSFLILETVHAIVISVNELSAKTYLEIIVLKQFIVFGLYLQLIILKKLEKKLKSKLFKFLIVFHTTSSRMNTVGIELLAYVFV